MLSPTRACSFVLISTRPCLSPCYHPILTKQLVRSCPSHADRLARALPLVLVLLPSSPLPREKDAAAVGEGGGEKKGSMDGTPSCSFNRGEAAKAAASLLALRRPLEAFLKTGMLDAVPSSGTACGRVCDDSSRSGRRRSEGPSETVTVGREEHSWKQIRGNDATLVAEEGCSYPELRALMTRCVAPLCDAAVGITEAGLLKEAVGAVGRAGNTLAQKRREARSKGVLTCLEAVLEVCGFGAVGERGGLSSATMSAAAASASAGVATALTK